MNFQTVSDKIHNDILSLVGKDGAYGKKNTIRQIYRMLIKLSVSIYNIKINKKKFDKRIISHIINVELYEQIMYSTSRIFNCENSENFDTITSLTSIANNLKHFKYYITSRKIFGIRKF